MNDAGWAPSVRHRLRRGQVYRALDLIVIKQEPGGADLVGQRDPEAPLRVALDALDPVGIM